MTPEEIKAVRLDLGVTMEQFAKCVGVTLGTVARWESGRSKPSPLAIEKIKYIKRQLV